MVTCKYCGREFKSENAYYAHKCEGYVNEREKKRKAKEEEDENGDFVCEGCSRHFKSATSLRSHLRFCEASEHKRRYDENGKYISNSKYKVGEEYVCECGKSYVNFQSFNAHLSHCEYHHECVGKPKKLRPHELTKVMSGWENKTEEEKAAIHKKSGKTHSKNLRCGITKNHWVGKKHTDLSKEHHREAAIKVRERLIPGCRAAYNEKACEYIDKLNEENNWHLQHALNGGEVKKFGFYLDGYDEALNIVFEYDEPKHYLDVEKNILKESDIKRQTYIINHLKCRFFRYNEKMKLLYEIK